jgi:serine/threonine-protein kinase RsbW
MRFAVGVTLPREAQSIPLARHLAAETMRLRGIADECVADLQVALTEAVTNVLMHADAGDEYEVTVSIDGEMAAIEVLDQGSGHNVPRDDWKQTGLASPDAESGRGIALMRALVDNVAFTPLGERGTAVRLEKRVTYRSNGRPAQAGPATGHTRRQPRRRGSELVHLSR